jgi:pimeloyl-ACP methyl ester carboxylesterase
VGDAVAVLKAARSDSAAVIGLNDGTIAAVLLAAAHPELCRSLVLFTLTGSHTLAAGLPMESIEEVLEMIQSNAVTDESGVQFLAPSRVGDERFDQQLARFQRFSVRPRAWAHYYRQTMKADVADVLPAIPDADAGAQPDRQPDRAHGAVPGGRGGD